MAFAKDLTGKRFGRLFVESRNYDKQKEVFEIKHQQVAFWNCVCDCGNKTIVRGSNLINGSTTSCGCYAQEARRVKKNTKDITWVKEDDCYIGITTKGDKFKIDIDDYEKVKNYCWRIDKYGYVVANARDKTNRIIRIYKLIMGVPFDKNIIIDHINWDKTDNRKCNLRFATKSQNNINIKRKSNNTSGYTGVHYNKRIDKYTARLSLNGKRLFLGNFANFDDAVKARHEAELKYHGEWSGEINRQDYLCYQNNMQENIVN